MIHKCIHLKERHKKGEYYLYCAAAKKIITFEDCKGCPNKCYKKYKPLTAKAPIKKSSHKVSKRAKACDISQKTKKEILIRDGGVCILCKQRKGKPEAHYIRRSKGGLGIPMNTFCVCEICHGAYDNGINADSLKEIAKEYLSNYYGSSWKEEDLYYKKWSV